MAPVLQLLVTVCTTAAAVTALMKADSLSAGLAARRARQADTGQFHTCTSEHQEMSKVMEPHSIRKSSEL